jgi:hypothetical protein
MRASIVQLSALFCAALAVSSTSSTVAHAEPASKSTAEERAYRYELRALGAYAGEAVFEIGKAEAVGKRELIPLRIDAFTAGLTASLLDARTASTTWVDTSWLPIRSRSDQVINKEKRTLKVSFEAKKLHGTDERDGKLFNKIDLVTDKHGLDLVSIFGWLMNADLSPAARHSVAVFDGRRLYNVDVSVGAATEVHVPIGMRRAIPLKIKVSRGTYKREMELWMSADKDRAPLKFVFKYGVVGTVEAWLVGEKKG